MNIVYGNKNAEQYYFPGDTAFCYSKSRAVGVFTFFHCSFKSCRVKIRLRDFNIQNEDGTSGVLDPFIEDLPMMHNHLSTQSKIHEMQLKHACRKRAAEENLDLRQIYDQECLRLVDLLGLRFSLMKLMPNSQKILALRRL